MNKKFIRTLIVTAITFNLCASSLAFAAEDNLLEGKDVKVNSSEQKNENNNGNIIPNNNLEGNIQSKKVIISEVDVKPEIIEPGKEFTINYKIENISGSTINGLSLKLVGLEGKGTLSGFTPLGTTNEIYAGSIAVNDVKYVSIKLISDSNLKPGAYNFVTSVMFNEYGKEQEEITKISGVVLRNLPELQIGNIEISPDGNLIASLINDGNGKLKRVNVTATVKDKKYNKYIGSIDNESEESYEQFLEPVSEDTTGNLEVTFEDEGGNKSKISKDFEVKAQIIEENKTKAKPTGGIIGFFKRLFNLGE